MCQRWGAGAQEATVTSSQNPVLKEGPADIRLHPWAANHEHGGRCVQLGLGCLSRWDETEGERLLWAAAGCWKGS